MATQAQTTDVRYPIGNATLETGLSEQRRRELIAQIEECPAKLRAAVSGLSPQQLATPYREGGWTVAQVTHHLFDSHVNAYIRFKLALTEDEPTIKPYDEKLWAELEDSRSVPIEVSLGLMDNLHQRWVVLLRSMSAAGFRRKLRHPERGVMDLDEMLSLYAWHSRHHVAHITSLRQRMGW